MFMSLFFLKKKKQKQNCQMDSRSLNRTLKVLYMRRSRHYHQGVPENFFLISNQLILQRAVLTSIERVRTCTSIFVRKHIATCDFPGGGGGGGSTVLCSTCTQNRQW